MSDAVHKAAHGLEAYFLRQVLAEVRTTGSLDGGFGAATFKEMLDESLADKMAESGGVGLAKMIVEQLGGQLGEGPLQQAPSNIAVRRPKQAYEISSGFGLRSDPIEGKMRAHHGIDLAAPVGKEVLSAYGGKVVRAERAGGYGNLVVVDHGDGLETRYAHLGEINVSIGDEITAGTKVGTVGMTGRTTGPHLHFELRREGEAVDPRSALEGLKILR